MVYMKAEVSLFDTVEGAGGAWLWICLRRRVKACPKTYFYVSFPDSCPSGTDSNLILIPVAFWHASFCNYMGEFSLLIHKEPAAIFQRLPHEQLKVKLDGPYGHRILLGNYDLVVLVANGKGIVGVLPFALSILFRNKQDKKDKERGAKLLRHCNKVRKVDLVWKLDCNLQIEWAVLYFTALSKMEANMHKAGRKRKKVLRVRLLGEL